MRTTLLLRMQLLLCGDLLLRTHPPQVGWLLPLSATHGGGYVLGWTQMDMVKRIRRGHFPDVNIDPFPDYVDWMKYDDHIHPMSSAPEPKRRFVPSKWEAKKVVKLVRALRRGWIKMDKPKEEPKLYLMWADDADMTSDKTANGTAPPWCGCRSLCLYWGVEALKGELGDGARNAGGVRGGIFRLRMDCR